MTTADTANEQQEFVDAVETWVEKELRPVARKYDLADEYPQDIVDQMKELGLFGATIGDAFFERFLHIVDRQELKDPAYLEQPARYADRALIERVIHEELVQHSSAYWLEKLRGARIPCGPVNDFAQALADPQVVARDMVVEVPLSGGGSVRMPGVPMKFSDSGTPDFSSPPTLGRDTEVVLRELLGYGKEAIGQLKSERAIQ